MNLRLHTFTKNHLDTSWLNVIAKNDEKSAVSSEKKQHLFAEATRFDILYQMTFIDFIYVVV